MSNALTIRRRCSLVVGSAIGALLANSVISSVTAYVPGNRWSVTASGATAGEGTPITLTWSFAPDGTTIPGEGPSDLVSYLDDIFNVSTSNTNLTQRPWFEFFEASFDRWSELGGINFVYEPNDDGLLLYSAGGALSLRGDIRIAGTLVDGPSGTLAFTVLPDDGDMVFDTGETSFFNNSSNNYRALRNTLMHEIGHAFGLFHVESSTSALLMEPIINTSFDGPQLDDVRGIQGLYGDPLEKTNNGLGNDTSVRATSLGFLDTGSSVSIGSDAVGSQAVSPTETDFVSIATNTDVDFYSFTVSTPVELDISLTPLGGVFIQGVEGGIQTSFDANARNDLSLAVFDQDGTTLLSSANSTAAGGIEALADLSLTSPGQYYARITGADDALQLYQLHLSAVSIVTVLPGDYNDDGSVDAADYTVWRDNLGAPPGTLPNDVDGGVIGAAQYATWTANFGDSTSGSPGAGAAQVPEPSSITLLVCALTGIAAIAAVTVRGGFQPPCNARLYAFQIK